MIKYRKRPIEIEAVKFDAGTDLVSVQKWLGPAGYLLDYRTIVIHTLEGDMKAIRGQDWIIKGIVGEFYACRNDVFDQTYESAAPPFQPDPDIINAARAYATGVSPTC